MFEIEPTRLRVETTAGVSTATLSRPTAGNALDRALADALVNWATAVDAGALDGSVRVAVLRHEGAMCCVGGDLKHFLDANDTAGELQYVAENVHRAIEQLNASVVPVVSVIDGVAAGGGLGVALVGDIVVATQRARFKMAYTEVGLSPDCGGSWLLTRRIGAGRAMEFALTNRTMGVAEAADLGLVTTVVDSEDLEAKVDALVGLLLKGPRAAQGETKRLIRQAESAGFSEQLADEAASIVRQSASAEGDEGVRAFFGKRPPVFL
jgi:2-(1,2-epoxy-1,2-dihydrophenyl)acetyl-CoA isomerase